MAGDASGAAPFLHAIRARFVPGRVLLHVDPLRLPRELASTNVLLRILIEEAEKSGAERPSVRVCENYACGLPMHNVEELEKIL